MKNGKFVFSELRKKEILKTLESLLLRVTYDFVNERTNPSYSLKFSLTNVKTINQLHLVPQHSNLQPISFRKTLHKFILPVLKILILKSTQRQEILNISANSHIASNSSSGVKKSDCSSPLEYLCNLGFQLPAFAFLSKADGDIHMHTCFRHFKAY